jgi:DNA-binding response OmpR family regulator
MNPDRTTVLIIDGDNEERQYYAERLKLCSPDYTIFESTSAKMGLGFFSSNPIDCVVLELVLPDASGFEVLLKLNPDLSRPETAVIVLTQLNSPSLFDLAVKNGAHSALHKTATSGETLHKTILSAVLSLRTDRNKKID